MSVIVRFGYCPPNPGPNNRLLKYIKWFNNIDDAIEAYDGRSSIWINTTGVYREISYVQLIALKDKYDTGR